MSVFKMFNLIILLFTTVIITAEAADGAWTPLAPGMELGTFIANKPSIVGDSKITILRIDPKQWELVLIGKSWDDKANKNQTAKEWCESHKLTAAINAGMFGADYSTHIGYLGNKLHVNNSRVNKYKSVAAFNPKHVKGLPEF